ncbi:MAG TPA: GIY-YIG nuclease family protein, partial [Bacteroidales bacterium]|nr:GIY-YIG nuclease family protein [Bacteroidales bacterium]
QEYNKTYVGYTSNLDGRLQSHNHPQNKGWTRKFQPWEIIYFEEFHEKKEAMIREKVLKTGKGREFIQNILQNR